MNGKQAKKLRKLALSFAATFDSKDHPVPKDGTTPVAPDQATLVNREDSYRSIYRLIKKGIRGGKIS